MENKICNDGFIVYKKKLTKKQIIQIKNDLNVKPYSSFGNFIIKSFKVYKETNDYYILPVYYTLDVLKIKPDIISFYNNCSINKNIIDNISLRNNQIECFNNCMNEFDKKFGGGIITLSCGQGKTIISLKIISQSKKKTLIIVNKIELLKQWKNEINKMLPGTKIGIIQGSKFEYENCDIVLGMLQTIAIKNELKSIDFNFVDNVIIDECFPYNTFILTNKGKIKIGELYDNISLSPLVKTFNEFTKSFEYKKILKVFRKQNKNLIEIKCGNLSITSTENHKFLTTNGWKKATSLSIEDYIISYHEKQAKTYGFSDYSYSKITDIKRNIINSNNLNYVYDLEIQENHNYIVYPKNSKLDNSTSEIGLIVHNCHNISSEVFSNIMFKVRPRYVFGLTATLERKDRLEKIIKWYMGKILYNGTSSDLKQSTEVHVYKYSGESSVEKYLRDGTAAVATMISNIAQDNQRNDKIINILKFLINSDENRHILVISDRIVQLKYIHNSIGTVLSGLFIGNMKSIDLEKSKEKRIVIGTYALVNEGFNLPKLNCLLFATPRSSIVQAIGRIYRKEHFITPLIIDIFDDFSIFKVQSYKRKNIYKKTIKDVYIVSKDLMTPPDLNVKKDCKYAFSDSEDDEENVLKICLLE